MFKRLLIKISGEALQSSKNNIDNQQLILLSQEINELKKQQHEIVIVLGAGNIWRYKDNLKSKIQRTTSDYMGMLGTVMNSVALQSILEFNQIASRVCSALNIPQLAESYIKRKALRHLDKGRVVICAGGTGNPFFTTDSAASLRALELNCDVIIKATKVDGVYDQDPVKNPSAIKYDKLSFTKAIQKNINIMDQTAFSLCKEGNMPIIVLNMTQKGNILKAAQKKQVGTLVC